MFSTDAASTTVGLTTITRCHQQRNFLSVIFNLLLADSLGVEADCTRT